LSRQRELSRVGLKISGADFAEIEKIGTGDCTVLYQKGGQTLATVTISRDLQSLRAEAAMEAAIRPQRQEVA
jgi:hypothetical protein